MSATKIQIMSITGKIENELLARGIKCHAGSDGLSWFTDKPIHAKSKNTQFMSKNKLDEPYMTCLGYKTAEKFLQELRSK